MNLEQLCRTIKDNWDIIPNKKWALKYLRYQFELLAWKRNKLKLGAIAFEIKEYKFDEVVLWEEPEIRYIRQDTTIEDEQKLENILKRLGWQWDMRNYIALSVVLFGAFCYVIALLKIEYYNRLPTLAFRDPHCDFILRFGFETCFTPRSVGIFNDFTKMNFWLVDLLTDFCIHFNIIF